MRATESRCATFSEAGGKTNFALSLMTDSPKKSEPRSTVILFDTSASQFGDVRQDGLEILKYTLKSLPSDSQVSVMACDVGTVDLSQGLQSPASESIKSAIDKLQARVPLGTTNLPQALRQASKLLPQGGVIVYIGDGITGNGILDESGFRNLRDQLVDQRISVISVAVGVATNLESLATLANHTGGLAVAQANYQGTSQNLGLQLAQAVGTPVFWPSKSNISEFSDNVVPAQIPPIRTDRDSIVFGSLKDATKPAVLKVEGELNGQPAQLEWEIAPEESNDDMAFATGLIDQADDNGGLYLPTAGSDALRELAAVFSNASSKLVDDARFAIQRGDLEAARTIIEKALEQAPNNLEAKNLLELLKNPPVKDDSAVSSRQTKVRLVAFQDDLFGSESAPASDDPFGSAAEPNQQHLQAKLRLVPTHLVLQLTHRCLQSLQSLLQRLKLNLIRA